MTNEPPRLLLATTSPMALSCFFATMTARIHEAGFEVAALSSEGPELADFQKRSGITAIVVPMKREISIGADIWSQFRMSQAIRRFGPEIVHTHTPKAGLLGMAAAWWNRVPVRIYTINGLPLMTRKGWKRWVLLTAEWIACKFATRVLCVSGSMRDAALQLGLCPDKKVVVLGYGSASGVDLNHFRFNLRQTTGIIGFVGRLTRDKGIEVLADAWKLLREEFPHLRLWLCGMFESQDAVSPSVRASLENDPRVRIFRAQPEEMPDVYQSLDLCLLPTFREGLPNVALECGAMGVPIVATKIPGCVDAIVDGSTGVLVPAGDAIALASASSALLKDSATRERMGAAAREFVSARFEEGVVVSFLVDEYLRQLNAVRSKRKAASSLKRCFDACVAALFLVLLAPLILTAFIAVRLTMGSPVFFRQQRAGLGGQPFSLCKLRTMTTGRDASGTLLPDHQRLTGLGRFLRRTSFDELPQFWNVLKGEMSLVGPRPLFAHYVARYDEFQRRRLEVLPGITGWAQIHGRNAMTWEEKFRFDVWYVDHRTLALDLKILLITLWKVVRGEGIHHRDSASMPEFLGSGGSRI